MNRYAPVNFAEHRARRAAYSPRTLPRPSSIATRIRARSASEPHLLSSSQPDQDTSPGPPALNQPNASRGFGPRLAENTFNTFSSSNHGQRVCLKFAKNSSLSAASRKALALPSIRPQTHPPPSYLTRFLNTGINEPVQFGTPRLEVPHLMDIPGPQHIWKHPSLASLRYPQRSSGMVGSGQSIEYGGVALSEPLRQPRGPPGTRDANQSVEIKVTEYLRRVGSTERVASGAQRPATPSTLTQSADELGCEDQSLPSTASSGTHIGFLTRLLRSTRAKISSRRVPFSFQEGPYNDLLSSGSHTQISIGTPRIRVQTESGTSISSGIELSFQSDDPESSPLEQSYSYNCNSSLTSLPLAATEASSGLRTSRFIETGLQSAQTKKGMEQKHRKLCGSVLQCCVSLFCCCCNTTSSDPHSGIQSNNVYSDGKNTGPSLNNPFIHRKQTRHSNKNTDNINMEDFNKSNDPPAPVSCPPAHIASQIIASPERLNPSAAAVQLSASQPVLIQGRGAYIEPPVGRAPVSEDLPAPNRPRKSFSAPVKTEDRSAPEPLRKSFNEPVKKIVARLEGMKAAEDKAGGEKKIADKQKAKEGFVKKSLGRMTSFRQTSEPKDKNIVTAANVDEFLRSNSGRNVVGSGQTLVASVKNSRQFCPVGEKTADIKVLEAHNRSITFVEPVRTTRFPINEDDLMRKKSVSLVKPACKASSSFDGSNGAFKPSITKKMVLSDAVDQDFDVSHMKQGPASHSFLPSSLLDEAELSFERNFPEVITTRPSSGPHFSQHSGVGSPSSAEFDLIEIDQAVGLIVCSCCGGQPSRRANLATGSYIVSNKSTKNFVMARRETSSFETLRASNPVQELYLPAPMASVESIAAKTMELKGLQNGFEKCGVDLCKFWRCGDCVEREACKQIACGDRGHFRDWLSGMFGGLDVVDSEDEKVCGP